MSEQWSPWNDIDQPVDYASHSVYELRYVDEHGSPRPLSRFLGTDSTGILYIGQRWSMEHDREDIRRAIETWNGHMAGNMIHILNRYSEEFRRQHNTSRLQYRFERHDSEGRRKQREQRLIKDYVIRYGEVPPLNSTIPERDGENQSIHYQRWSDSGAF